MAARLEVTLDVASQKVWCFPEDSVDGRPSAKPTAAVLAKDFSSSIDTAAADTNVTQETTNTTSNGATTARATSMTLDAVTGIDFRKSYLITNVLEQTERARVMSIDSVGLVVTFDEPLEFAHADAATFQGTGFYYTLQSGDVDTLGEGFRIRFTYTVGGQEYVQDVAFDVVKVPLINPLTAEFLKKRHSGIMSQEPSSTRGTDFADLREQAWDRCMKGIRNAGTEPDHWRPGLLKTPDDVEEWAMAELELLLYKNGVDVLPGDWEPERAIDYLENRARTEREGALSSLEWMDTSDDDSRADEEQRPSPGPDYVR